MAARRTMLERSFALRGSGGGRVRLRLARPADHARLASLLERCGAGSDRDAARLARYDPRHRAVVCATELVDGVEQLVGAGSIDLGAGTPDLIVTAPELDGGRSHREGVHQLVCEALVARAGSWGDRRR